MPKAKRRLFLPNARQVHALIVIGFLSLGYALYLRYLAVEHSQVGLACQAGLDTWLCFTRRAAIAMFTHSVIGWVALTAALLNLLRPSVFLFGAALIAAAFGIVLYNVALSGLAAGLLILSLARPAPATG
jgi:hypothetical protein